MNEDEFYKRLAQAMGERDQAMRDYLEACRARDEAQRALSGEAAHIKSLGGLLADAARERDEARRDLGEILAVIHRDGGHHTGEHGVSKSVADAHATWAAVVRERDDARVEADSARAIYEMAAEVAVQREADAEVRGARWGLQVALDSSKWPVSKWTPEEVCRDARERGEG